jgi:hypothetical protein
MRNEQKTGGMKEASPKMADRKKRGVIMTRTYDEKDI